GALPEAVAEELDPGEEHGRRVGENPVVGAGGAEDGAVRRQPVEQVGGDERSSRPDRSKQDEHADERVPEDREKSGPPAQEADEGQVPRRRRAVPPRGSHRAQGTPRREHNRDSMVDGRDGRGATGDGSSLSQTAGEELESVQAVTRRRRAAPADA